MDRLLKKPLNKAVGGPNSPSCWWHVFISLVVVGVYLWEWRYWSLFVLVTCVYLHLGGMYFCDDGGQVCISLRDGGSCWSLCWWTVYLWVFISICDDWCRLWSVLVACVYHHLHGICLFLWWWLVLTAVCVAGLCISPSWWYVFISVMMVGVYLHLWWWLVLTAVCVGGLYLPLCWWPVFISCLLQVLIACILFLWWWQAVIHDGGRCWSPSVRHPAMWWPYSLQHRDILAKKRRKKERENKNKGKLCPNQLYRLSLSTGRLVASVSVYLCLTAVWWRPVYRRWQPHAVLCHCQSATRYVSHTSHTHRHTPMHAKASLVMTLNVATLAFAFFSANSGSYRWASTSVESSS